MDKDFNRILRAGRVYSDKSLKIFIFPADNGLEYVRLGLVVSRKLGSSVERNKLKRRLREVFRLNKHRLIRKIDMIFLPGQKSIDLNYRELEKIIFSLWGKANIISD